MVDPITKAPAVFCRYCGNLMQIDTVYSDSISRPNLHRFRCRYCGATSPERGTAGQALAAASSQPEARILTFSQLWQVPSFWLETKAEGGNLLAPDAVATFRNTLFREKPMGLMFASGQARIIGLFEIQWRAWSAKPHPVQQECVVWMTREERDKWLESIQDETWLTVNRK